VRRAATTIAIARIALASAIARIAVASAIAFAAACNRGETGLGPAASDSIDLPSPVLSAKRPTVRFYMERTSDRCSVYWTDGDVKGPPTDQACPEDLALGDRVRIAGMTCTRENALGEPPMPTLCPVALLRFERSYRLAAASAAASASSAPSGGANLSASASARAAPSSRAAPKH
jgi:hypothetical protein